MTDIHTDRSAASHPAREAAGAESAPHSAPVAGG